MGWLTPNPAWFGVARNADLHIHPMSIHRPYIHTCIHTYTHTYIHTYIHAYIHTYIHTYMRTYIHTYTHAHVHVDMCHPRIRCDDPALAPLVGPEVQQMTVARKRRGWRTATEISQNRSRFAGCYNEVYMRATHVPISVLLCDSLVLQVCE